MNYDFKAAILMLRAVLFGSLIFIADYVVKVPHMADSISEGSLKQWNKST